MIVDTGKDYHTTPPGARARDPHEHRSQSCSRQCNNEGKQKHYVGYQG